MPSIGDIIRTVFVVLFITATGMPSVADDRLIAQLETLLSEPLDPKAPGRFAFSLEGCTMTRSILHDKDRICSRSQGGWYRRDLIIDLRLLETSPSGVTVRDTKYDWEQIEWPFRKGIAEKRRAYLEEWEARHTAILRKDMALPKYDLPRRMEKLRALIEEMFPNRRFSGHSERVEYCGGAGALHAPARLWQTDDVHVALLPVDSASKIVDLIHQYAQRHCAKDQQKF